MIGVELDAQRSHPAAFARGIMSALGGETSPAAIAAVRNVCEVLILQANKLTEGKWLR